MFKHKQNDNKIKGPRGGNILVLIKDGKMKMIQVE